MGESGLSPARNQHQSLARGLEGAQLAAGVTVAVITPPQVKHLRPR